MFQITNATAAELDEFGAYFIHVTQAVQRAGVHDYGQASRLTVHRARRILVGFITRDDASTLGRAIGADYLASPLDKIAVDAVARASAEKA